MLACEQHVACFMLHVTPHTESSARLKSNCRRQHVAQLSWRPCKAAAAPAPAACDMHSCTFYQRSANRSAAASTRSWQDKGCDHNWTCKTL